MYVVHIHLIWREAFKMLSKLLRMGPAGAARPDQIAIRGHLRQKDLMFRPD